MKRIIIAGILGAILGFALMSIPRIVHADAIHASADCNLDAIGLNMSRTLTAPSYLSIQ